MQLENTIHAHLPLQFHWQIPQTLEGLWVSERQVQQMWEFSLERLIVQERDCWFELPGLALHQLCEEEDAAFKAPRMHV